MRRESKESVLVGCCILVGCKQSEGQIILIGIKRAWRSEIVTRQTSCGVCRNDCKGRNNNECLEKCNCWENKGNKRTGEESRRQGHGSGYLSWQTMISPSPWQCSRDDSPQCNYWCSMACVKNLKHGHWLDAPRNARQPIKARST